MDKQELRQDPIRERMISFLTKLENNKNIIFGLFILAILSITFATYYADSTKEKNKISSINLGKAINTKIDGDNETSNLLFSDLLLTGSGSSKSISLIHLINYHLSKADGDIFSIDSYHNVNVKSARN